MENQDEIVRVVRVLEYIGPRGWVEMVLEKSFQVQNPFMAPGSEDVPKEIMVLSESPQMVIRAKS